MFGVGELIGAGVVALGAWILSKRFLRDSAAEGRKRSLSFSSQSMMSGAFPPNANVWAPIINIVFYFKTVPSAEQLAQVGDKLCFYDRFRSVAVADGSDVRFEECEVDVLKDLISTISVSDDAGMAEIIDDICGKPFDCQDTKPLWRFIRIENKKGKNGLLIRIHHSIGDGISLIGVIGKVFRTEQGLPYSIDVPEKAGGGTQTNSITLAKWVKGFFEVATLANTKFDSNIKFTDPDKKNMVMSNTRKTILMPTLKLDFLKAIKNSAKVTINDVMLSLTAGTIRRYCLSKNDPLFADTGVGGQDKVQNRVLMPVAFPRPKIDTESSSKALRNLWSFVSTGLPLGAGSSIDRVKKCCEQTKKLKSSPMAFIQLWLQNNVVAAMPKFMQRQIAFDVFARHSLVFSNMPGPAEYLTFCDEKLLGMQCIFPNLIPQVIIISYAGDVFFSLNLDPDLVDACDELPKLFIEEVTALAKAANVDCSSDKMYSSVFRPAGH